MCLGRGRHLIVALLGPSINETILLLYCNTNANISDKLSMMYVAMAAVLFMYYPLLLKQGTSFLMPLYNSANGSLYRR